MKLDVNGDLIIENIDQDSLIDSLGILETSEGGFAVLSKSDVTYIYVEGSPEEGFQLECQEGSLDRHYRSVESNLELSLVINAFSQYLMGDEQWKFGIHWDRLIIANGDVDHSLTNAESINKQQRSRHNALPTLLSIINDLRSLRRWWFGLGLGVVLLLISGELLGALLILAILLLHIIWVCRKIPGVLLLERYGDIVKAVIINVGVNGGDFVGCKYLHDHYLVQRISHSESLHMELGEEVLIRYLPKFPGIARVENLSSR